jgi:hypothetical protein
LSRAGAVAPAATERDTHPHLRAWRNYREHAQVLPQRQVSPQWHPARRVLLVSWQPQAQVAPAHDTQAQAFGVEAGAVVVVVDMCSSCKGG